MQDGGWLGLLVQFACLLICMAVIVFKGQTQLVGRFQLLFAEEAVCLVVAACLSDSCVL